jgi:hypothetical protein
LPLSRYVDGQLRAKYGDAFIRGNNVMCCLPVTAFRFAFLNALSPSAFLLSPYCQVHQHTAAASVTLRRRHRPITHFVQQ